MMIDKKPIKRRRAKLLWLDLEMTGLSVENDLILEVAIIATDWNFKEIDVYQGVVKNKKSEMMERFKSNSVFWDANAVTRDNLISQNETGKSLVEIEDEIIEFIDKNFKSGVPVLCAGNSVHIDRRFIVKNWPKLESRLHYRMLDVSAWKVVFEGKYRKKFVKSGSHRALDDIRGSTIELQHYLTKVR